MKETREIYVAFKYVYDEDAGLTHHYGDLFIYHKGIGEVFMLPHVSYSQLGEVYDYKGYVYNGGLKTDQDYVRRALAPVYSTYMKHILYMLRNYMMSCDNIVDTYKLPISENDLKVEFLSHADDDKITDHHSLVLHGNGMRVFLGGVTADDLHEYIELYSDRNKSTEDLIKIDRFRSFINKSTRNVPGWGNQSSRCVCSTIWKYYSSQLTAGGISKRILDKKL